MLSFGRSAAIPLAAVVFGLAALSGPPVALRSLLMILGVGAVGLTLLTAASWWRASADSRRNARARDARRVDTEDASDDARMGSDAG